MKVKAITRLAVTLVLFANAILTAAGKNPIPLDEATITEFVSYVASFSMLVWSWWKNAPMTQIAAEEQGRIEIRKGKQQDNVIVEDLGGEDNE